MWINLDQTHRGQRESKNNYIYIHCGRCAGIIYFSIRRRRRIPKTNSTDAFPEDETKPKKTNCPPTNSSPKTNCPRRRTPPRRRMPQMHSPKTNRPSKTNSEEEFPEDGFLPEEEFPEDELPPRRLLPKTNCPPPKMKVSRILKTSPSPKTNCPMKMNSYILPRTCHPRIVLRTAVDDS